MIRTSRTSVVALVVIGVAIMAELQACAPRPMSPPDLAPGVFAVRQFRRVAEGTNTPPDSVTVDVTIFTGPVADTNMSPGPPITFASFSNRGEHGRREKRYAWRGRPVFRYELVLSNDGTGKTKWTMNEINIITHSSTEHAHGHLWT